MKLIVLTDTGTFKAFKLEQDQLSSSARLEPVENYKSPLGDDRISLRVSDSAGQNTKGSVAGAANNDGATGERHNICLEAEKTSIKQIAQTMNQLLDNGDFESCLFAASEEINKPILEHLSPNARAKIEKNLQCNLVNAPRDQVLNHFKI